MKKLALILIAMLTFGLLAGVLRFVELRTVFDAASGLPERGALLSYALLALSAAAALAAFAVSFNYLKETENGAPASLVWPILEVLAAFFLFFTAASQFLAAVRGAVATQLVLAIFEFVSAIALMYMATVLAKGKKLVLIHGLIYSIPVVWLCFDLMMLFRGISSDPVLLDYIYDPLVVAFVLLATYKLASRAYAQPKRRAAAMNSLLGIFFAALCLIGRWFSPDTLVTFVDINIAYYSKLAFIILHCAAVFGISQSAVFAPPPPEEDDEDDLDIPLIKISENHELPGELPENPESGNSDTSGT